MKLAQNNLLIVEDNPVIRKKIYTKANELGSLINIQLTESLQEAISFLNETNFKIITLDLRLPDGNGLELLKWLKENPADTKVFVFSMSTELKQICLKYGAFDFFDKAKDFDKLIEAIKTNS